MSTYTPDFWRILKIRFSSTDKVHYRVLATWSGSYTWGESWKISSGIEGFEDKEDHYISPQTSGSTYRLNKTREGANGYLMSVYTDYYNQAVKQYGEGNFIFDLINAENFLKEYHEH